MGELMGVHVIQRRRRHHDASGLIEAFPSARCGWSAALTCLLPWVVWGFAVLGAEKAVSFSRTSIEASCQNDKVTLLDMMMSVPPQHGTPPLDNCNITRRGSRVEYKLQPPKHRANVQCPMSRYPLALHLRGTETRPPMDGAPLMIVMCRVGELQPGASIASWGAGGAELLAASNQPSNSPPPPRQTVLLSSDLAGSQGSCVPCTSV